MIVRNKASLLVLAALLGVAAAQFSGCEKYILPELSISQDTLRFSASLDSAAIHVTTNVITTVDPPTEDFFWVSANPNWMEESCDVMVKVQENNGQERTSTIPFKSEIIQKNLVVIQAGKQ